MSLAEIDLTTIPTAKAQRLRVLAERVADKQRLIESQSSPNLSLPPAEAALRASCRIDTILIAAMAGDLPCDHVEGGIVIAPAALEEWNSRHRRLSQQMGIPFDEQVHSALTQPPGNDLPAELITLELATLYAEGAGVDLVSLMRAMEEGEIFFSTTEVDGEQVVEVCEMDLARWLESMAPAVVPEETFEVFDSPFLVPVPVHLPEALVGLVDGNSLVRAAHNIEATLALLPALRAEFGIDQRVDSIVPLDLASIATLFTMQAGSTMGLDDMMGCVALRTRG
jgi:hypothetical protein